MQKKFHIKKGDTVLVITGEYKGSEGKVLRMLPELNKAIVEGINIISKATKPSQKNPDGGIQKIEAPIHLSNLKLIDPSTGKPTKIGRKYNEAGKLVRYSKITKEEIK